MLKKLAAEVVLETYNTPPLKDWKQAVEIAEANFASNCETVRKLLSQRSYQPSNNCLSFITLLYDQATVGCHTLSLFALALQHEQVARHEMHHLYLRDNCSMLLRALHSGNVEAFQDMLQATEQTPLGELPLKFLAQ